MLTSNEWGIRRRLVFIVVGVSIVTTVLVASIALSANVSNLRAQTQRLYLASNQTLANRLDTYLQSGVNTANVLANLMANQPLPAISQVWQTASNMLGNTANPVRRISVYAPLRSGHQTTIFNAPIAPSRVALIANLVNNTLPADAWILQTLRDGKPRWYGPAKSFDINSTDTVISYAVPYMGNDNRYTGVVWVEIPVRDLQSVMDNTMEMDDRRGYSLLLTDADALAATYKLSNERKGQLTAIVNGFLRETDIVNLRGQVGPASGAFTLTGDPFSQWQSALILANPLPRSGWQIISVLPSSALQVPFDRTIMQVAAVALSGMVLLAWAVWRYVGRTVSQPLRTLGTAAQEIGSGDMRYTIQHQDRHDEIGRLARAMDDMKVNLAHSYRQLSLWSQMLEKRVTERTEELQAAQREAQANAAELQAVYDASLSVVGDHELDDILQKMSESLAELLKSRYCAVWLLNDDKTKLQLVATTAADKSRLGMMVGAGEGLIGMATEEARLVIIDNYAQWPRRLNTLADDNVERAMSTPLMFYKRPIGAVLVGRRLDDPSFTERDQRLLTLFANLVSPVVRNAQLFAQRRTAMREAERANSVKTRFLASVTHELRTPLNLIINNMDFMRIGQFGDVNDEQRNRLDQTIRSAEHLLYLINDLLDVSKIEAGEMELTIKPADLHPVLEDALDSALMLIDSKGANLHFQTHIPAELPVIPMDARRVRQVLTNLLSNAIKFTDQGSVDLYVRVLPDIVEFSVEDTGMGIAQDEIPKLFEAFQRSDRAKYLSIEGTGLGLPISRYLVEAHGGTMSVWSKVGQGSRFSFTLPRCQVEPDEQPQKTLADVIMRE
jgi:signal transduction histidine kinase/methyl-accepting chemotaxis protein